MMTKWVTIICLISISSILLSQSILTEISSDYRYYKRNDSLSTGLYSDYLMDFLNDSICIEEYGINIRGCHSYWVKDGSYIKRSKEGQIIEIGEYQRNKKVGRWIYFYDSGLIKRIENYSRPFDNKYWRDLNTKMLHSLGPFKSGDFFEYYENGHIKTKGSYELVEIKLKEFFITGVDEETYEEKPIKVKDENWVPQSIRSGIWREFDTEGLCIKVQEYEIRYVDTLRMIPQIPELDAYNYLD